MINIRILKVTHSGDEFRKLLPHVQWAHVWAPENAGSSEEEARIKEDAWEKLLASGMSRTRLLEKTREAVGDLPQNQGVYVIGMNDYLFKSKLPEWMIERFPQKQAGMLRATKMTIDNLYDDSIVVLASGNIDRYMELRKRALDMDKPLNEARDKEMGRNLDRAEEAIRERYSSLKDRQPLNLVTSIGGLHWPESYMTTHPEVIDLSTEATSLNDLVCERVLKGSSYDELRTLILASGVADLARNGYLFTNGVDLKTLDFDGLVKLVQGVKSV
jgi:hypothetical protein